MLIMINYLNQNNNRSHRAYLLTGNANEDDGFGVSPDDIDNTATVNGGNGGGNNDDNGNAKRGGPPLPKLSRDELRSKELSELQKLLEIALVVVSAQSPSPLIAPLDVDMSLVNLGLDSFSVVQFKGLLEKR